MQTKLLINGELVEGKGDQLAVENPYDCQTLATLNAASDEQVDAAVRTAGEAAGAWAQSTAGDRCELLHGVARELLEKSDQLARLMTQEGGKTLTENSDEVGWTAACFDYYAELGRNFAGRVIPPVESSQIAMVVKEPIGVVACIVPWNYPLLLLAWKLAPALAAGNTIVCKPSELTPLSTLTMANLFRDFPPGVVNILAGDGKVGARIVADDSVDCVAFTGSVETGKQIAAKCAERIARVNLELGGKDPFIVCSDIAENLDIAVMGGAWAAFLNAGQVCTSAERFYVMKDVYDDYVSSFVSYTEGLIVGDPLDPNTDIGPMVTAAQREKVVTQVEDAVNAGAELLTGTTEKSDGEDGHLFFPAVITGSSPQTQILREETFGPVAPIVPVNSLDEAIKLANSTRFGLGCNVYTRDIGNIRRCMREIKAGTVWFNDPLTDNDAGPFGGFKQSGLGRELGQEGIEAFQETKHVHIETEIEAKEWWFPPM